MRLPPYFSEFEGLDKLASYNPNKLVFYNYPKQSRSKRSKRKRQRKKMVEEWKVMTGDGSKH